MRTGDAILALIIMLSGLSGYAQMPAASGLYTVDKQVNIQLKKFVVGDSNQLGQSMKVKVPWGNRIFFDQSLDCYTESYLRSDTIFITGFMLNKLGYGFALALFRDSCIVAPFALSDAAIYKGKISDTVYTDMIVLPCLIRKVVLPEKPIFKEGEIITGFVALDSYPFYYKSMQGEFKIELTAYFRTTPIRLME